MNQKTGCGMDAAVTKIYDEWNIRPRHKIRKDDAKPPNGGVKSIPIGKRPEGAYADFMPVSLKHKQFGFAELGGVCKANSKLSAGQHNRQQATGNRQQATGNRQQATGNRQQIIIIF
jgi:hypothetical protein